MGGVRNSGSPKVVDTTDKRFTRSDRSSQRKSRQHTTNEVVMEGVWPKPPSKFAQANRQLLQQQGAAKTMGCGASRAHLGAQQEGGGEDDDESNSMCSSTSEEDDEA